MREHDLIQGDILIVWDGVLVLVPLAAGSYLLGLFVVIVCRSWEVNACGRCGSALLFGLEWISAVVVGLLCFTAF